MNRDLPWVPPEKVVDSEETRISVFGAVPLVNGMGLESIVWYRVTPQKVTICFSEGKGRERTREFNIRDVELSGWPKDQLFARKDSPRDESPV